MLPFCFLVSFKSLRVKFYVDRPHSRLKNFLNRLKNLLSICRIINEMTVISENLVFSFINTSRIKFFCEVVPLQYFERMEIAVENQVELRLSKNSGVKIEDQATMLGLDKDYDRYMLRKKNCSDRQRWSRGKTSRYHLRTNAGSRRTFFLSNMTVLKPCRHSLGAPVIFWTTVFLILLAKGVNSNEEQSRIRRSPKFDQGYDLQGGFIVPKNQETYQMMQFLRELLQRQRASQQQVQVYNGEDLRENQIDWRKIPLPLLNQIRSIINDGSKDEDKRGSYMSLCHFKICNLG